MTTEANRAVIELAFEKIGMNKLTALTIRTILHLERSWRNQVCVFPMQEQYACIDQHEEGRIVTRVHYVLTKEDYFANK